MFYEPNLTVRGISENLKYFKSNTNSPKDMSLSPNQLGEIINKSWNLQNLPSKQIAQQTKSSTKLPKKKNYSNAA